MKNFNNKLLFEKYKNVLITINITDDESVRSLNGEYRNCDGSTDVLSFSQNDELDDDTYQLGDIAVSAEQARRQSMEYGNSFEEEISQLISHGVLHLLGIHHPGDE